MKRCYTASWSVGLHFQTANRNFHKLPPLFNIPRGLSDGALIGYSVGGGRIEGCLNDSAVLMSRVVCRVVVVVAVAVVVLDLHPDPQPGQPQHADGEERVPGPPAGPGGGPGQEEALPAVPARGHPGQGVHGPLGPGGARRGHRLAHQLQQVGGHALKKGGGGGGGGGCF